MTLEEMIRQIVREEIARMKQVTTTKPLSWRELLDGPAPCSRCGVVTPAGSCFDTACPMRPPVVTYGTAVPPRGLYDGFLSSMSVDEALATGTAVLEMKGKPDGSVVVKNVRLGCACAPGTERICDEETCPWKQP